MNKFFLKNKTALIFLTVILIIGFYIRIGGIISNSFAFTYDVGRDLIQVGQIVNGHKIPLIGQTTGLGGLYYGPWWYYILTPPFTIVGGNPQGIASFMVILGMAIIILGFFYGQKIGGLSVGLITAVFLSFSSVMVGFSSQIWNPNIAPFLLLLLFYVLATESKKREIQFFSALSIGLILGLILDAEIVFGVLTIISSIIFLIWEKRRSLLKLSNVGIILGFLIILSPRIFFEIRHNFIMTKSLLVPHSQDQRIFDPYNFFNVLPDRLFTLLGQFSETFGIDSKLGLILLVVIAVSIIMFWKKIPILARKATIMCFIMLSVFILGSSIFARAIWGHYLVGLPIVYLIIASISLTLIVRKNLIVGIALFVIFALTSLKPIGIIESAVHPNWEGNAAVFRNQVAVIDYIYKSAKGKQFNYIAYTPVVLDYTYQYLFSWYGSKKYGYVPAKKTEHLFYVIIEPDPGYEKRVVEWLKVREGDGKVIFEKVVKGGITVQTRLR